MATTVKTRFVLVLGLGSLFALAACTAGTDDESTGESQGRVVLNEAGDGYVMEKCWDGGYNLCTNNCHHAANCGVDAGNDGVIACYGGDAGSLGGHSVNWDTVPCASGQTGTCYCVAEPQLPGSAACCWNQPSGGGINVSSGDGLACVNKLCRVDSGAVAFEAGVTWDFSQTYCAQANTTEASCRTCCKNIADRYRNMKGVDASAKYQQQIADWEAACNASCADLP